MTTTWTYDGAQMLSQTTTTGNTPFTTTFLHQGVQLDSSERPLQHPSSVLCDPTKRRLFMGPGHGYASRF